MAPKRKQRSNTSLAAAASSDEGILSAIQVVQRPTPTKNPLAAAPADQESDGSDGDEVERQPPPKKMAAAELPKKNAASPESSPLKRKAGRSPPLKKKGKAAAQAAQVVRPPLPKMSATAAASEAANSPGPKKAAPRTEVALTPPPTGPEDEMANSVPLPEAASPSGAGDQPQPQEGESDAEKHLKEKSQTYWYLWQMALILEQEHSHLFKGSFLKIDDAKASILNTKLKKLSRQEIKQQLKWKDTDKEVVKVLLNLIK